MIIHNRRFFYKYTTIETALLILRNRKLKYSSPILFNDPFDVQMTLDYDFTLNDLNQALLKELDRLALSEQEPLGIPTNPWYKKLLQAWQARKGHSKTSYTNLLRQIHNQLVIKQEEKRQQEINKLNHWWQILVKASRVFCVAEEYDNILMWAHYANDHTGVVLEFECLPALDNPICAASKVRYTQAPVPIGKLDDYVKYYTGQIPSLEHESLFYDLFTTKSSHWAYEKEWRVFIPPYDMENPKIPKDNKGNDILSEFVELYPQELSATYFGCKVDPRSQKEIEDNVVGDLRHVKRFIAIRNDKDYRLDFVQQ